MAAIDPVCGMSVDEEEAPATSEFEGREFYFCSAACKQAFDTDPEAYAQ